MSGSSNLKEEISKDDELKKYFSISAMAVSYTHLDVYKRQLYELRVTVADGGALDLSETEKEIRLSVVLGK